MYLKKYKLLFTYTSLKKNLYAYKLMLMAACECVEMNDSFVPLDLGIRLKK